ncbi:hypothetical protein QUB08_00235 [Microcoleus sp. BR0-C5]|uniref:hypothetical protein n=1 Tax=Microcoleus sp. BR0-C5 TaxID=2818713 RepID=UPI002FD39462
MKSPSHSESRLKPTEQPDLTITDFSPLSEDFRYETGISIPVGLSNSPIDPDRTQDPDCPLQDRAYPQARRGLKSPSHSESRLKPTEQPDLTITDFSPLSEDFRYETGISIPVGLSNSPIDSRLNLSIR